MSAKKHDRNRSMCADYASGMAQKEIARKHGVSIYMTSHILAHYRARPKDRPKFDVALVSPLMRAFIYAPVPQISVEVPSCEN